MLSELFRSESKGQVFAALHEFLIDRMDLSKSLSEFATVRICTKVHVCKI